MPNEVATKLIARANALVSALQDLGVKSSAIEASLREYSIKVDLPPAGRVVVYYSPKKDRYRYQFENVGDDALKATVDSAWEPKKHIDLAEATNDEPSSGQIHIYVDGSFLDGSVGFGAVAVQGENILWESSGSVPGEEAGSTRQVAGELKAVMESFEWCKAQGILETSVYYDYEGIEKWATGAWKANKTVTQQYKQYIEQLDIQVTWVKVDAHTGDRWNEYADNLAKQGASSGSTAESSDESVDFESTTRDVIAFLQSSGFRHEIKQDRSEPYRHIQMAVSKDNDAWGYLNVYGSNRGVNIRFHEIGQEKRTELESLWLGRNASIGQPLAEIDYYYSLLRPFAEYHFDFFALANAIGSIWPQFLSSDFSPEANRYSFVSLEASIQQLRAAIATRKDGLT